MKKTHILRCARSSRYNVLAKYASARRFFARLGSEIFLSSLQSGFFINLLVREKSLAEIQSSPIGRGGKKRH
jgi:hypothetical protein